MHAKCTSAVFKLACHSNWHIVDMPPEEDKIEVCAVAVYPTASKARGMWVGAYEKEELAQLQKQEEGGWVHMRKDNWQHLVFIISLCN